MQRVKSVVVLHPPLPPESLGAMAPTPSNEAEGLNVPTPAALSGNPVLWKPASPGCWPAMHVSPGPLAQPCKAIASPQRNQFGVESEGTAQGLLKPLFVPICKPGLPKHIGGIMRNNGIKIMSRK